MIRRIVQALFVVLMLITVTSCSESESVPAIDPNDIASVSIIYYPDSDSYKGISPAETVEVTSFDGISSLCDVLNAIVGVESKTGRPMDFPRYYLRYISADGVTELYIDQTSSATYIGYSGIELGNDLSYYEAIADVYDSYLSK